MGKRWFVAVCSPDTIKQPSNQIHLAHETKKAKAMAYPDGSKTAHHTFTAQTTTYCTPPPKKKKKPDLFCVVSFLFFLPLLTHACMPFDISSLTSVPTALFVAASRDHLLLLTSIFVWCIRIFEFSFSAAPPSRARVTPRLH